MWQGLLFLFLGLAIVSQLRIGDAAFLFRDAAIELVNLRLHRISGRISRLELRHQPLIFGRQFSPALPQSVDRGVAQRLGRRPGLPALLIAGLRRDAVGGRLRQRAIESRQIIDHDGSLGA